MSEPYSIPPDRPEAGSHTIASTLRAARQEQGLTLSHAAATLRLSVPDLADLERQDDASVVADVHAMARLRVYGRYLAVDPERMLTTALQTREGQAGSPGQALDAAPPSGTLPAPPTEGESRGKRVSAVALLATLGIVAAVGAAAAAVVFNDQAGQQVQLTGPGDGQPQESSDAEGPARSLTSDGGLPSDDETAGLGAAGDAGLGAAGEGLGAAGDAPGGDVDNAEGAADGERGGASADTAGAAALDNGDSHPSGDAAGDPEAATEAAEEQADDEELPGRAPEQTSVQVLDGAGNPGNRDAVVGILEDHGYVVAAVNAARNPREQSTVFYSEGWEDEAEALAAREDGFVVSDENPGFADDIGLHVVVGSDWSS